MCIVNKVIIRPLIQDSWGWNSLVSRLQCQLAVRQLFVMILKMFVNVCFIFFRDPRPSYQNVVRMVRDVNIRLQNWDILIKNIRAYYAVSFKRCCSRTNLSYLNDIRCVIFTDFFFTSCEYEVTQWCMFQMVIVGSLCCDVFLEFSFSSLTWYPVWLLGSV